MDAEIRAEGIAFALEDAALAVGGQALSFRLEHDRYPEVFLPMFGEHFARNAVLGAAAARALLGDRTLSEEILIEAFGAMAVPGRLEVAHRKPLVVLDGAHNPAAAAGLAEAMPGAFRYERLFLVVSVMADKDVDGVLAPLVRIADEVIVTRNASPRAADPDDLATRVRALGGAPRTAASVADAIKGAIAAAGEADCILVSGSLYTVGEARQTLIPS